MLTRTEYNRIKTKILAGSDADSIRRGLKLLEITAEEGITVGVSDDEKQEFIDKVNEQVPTDFKEYKTVFWGYFEDFDNHNSRPGVFISDKDESTIIAYALGDPYRKSYRNASKTYTLKDPAAANLGKDTGVYLDDEHPVSKSDLEIRGMLAPEDVEGLAVALGIDISSCVNIFETIDVFVDTIFHRYKNNLTTI